jgi:hypothetical protein
VTDLLRVLLLARGAATSTTALEFVPHEHTRKNTLVRAVRGDDADRRDRGRATVRRAGGGDRRRRPGAGGAAREV